MPLLNHSESSLLSDIPMEHTPTHARSHLLCLKIRWLYMLCQILTVFMLIFWILELQRFLKFTINGRFHSFETPISYTRTKQKAPDGIIILQKGGMLNILANVMKRWNANASVKCQGVSNIACKRQRLVSSVCVCIVHWKLSWRQFCGRW